MIEATTAGEVAVSEARHLLSVQATLGEGPCWFDDALWFVDIKSKRLYRHDPAKGALVHWDAPEFIGWALPSAGGDLIVGLQSGPHRFDPATGVFTQIARVHVDLPDNRLNDAATHASGRLYFGTMDNVEAGATGQVFVLDAGVVSETSIPPTEITNGPAISPDGETLYHVDTLARTVTAHAVAADGTLGPAKPFLTITDDAMGYPDGAICDAQGGVWIAFFFGSAARRFAPDGTMTHEVRFPVSNITKVALGGPDGLTGYATTARQGLSEEQLAAQPLAGDVFTFAVDVGAAPLVPANT